MPDPLFFYEHKSLGKWWPRTEPGIPVTRTSEGKVRHIRGVIEVDPRHAGYTLKSLRELYCPDGLLIHTQGHEHLCRVLGVPS
jgi:hypothetical protein